MLAHQEPGVTNTNSHIIADVAGVLSRRAGEGPERQATRLRVATDMIEDFRPRNVVEAMLAGHSVMFHELMLDTVRDALREEPGPRRRGSRTLILAFNKALHQNLDWFAAGQAEPADAGAVIDQQPRDAPAPAGLGAEPADAGAVIDETLPEALAPASLAADAAAQTPPAQTPPTQTLPATAAAPVATQPAAAQPIPARNNHAHGGQAATAPPRMPPNMPAIRHRWAEALAPFVAAPFVSGRDDATRTSTSVAALAASGGVAIRLSPLAISLGTVPAK
jgi:hypothetical protein